MSRAAYSKRDEEEVDEGCWRQEEEEEWPGRQNAARLPPRMAASPSVPASGNALRAGPLPNGLAWKRGSMFSSPRSSKRSRRLGKGAGTAAQIKLVNTREKKLEEGKERGGINEKKINLRGILLA